MDLFLEGWKTLWENEEMLATSIFCFFLQCFQKEFPSWSLKVAGDCECVKECFICCLLLRLLLTFETLKLERVSNLKV